MARSRWTLLAWDQPNLVAAQRPGPARYTVSAYRPASSVLVNQATQATRGKALQGPT